MGKKRMTPLAQALVLVDSLSSDELATLADYLRGKLPQRVPKSTSAPSARSKSLLKRLEAQSVAITGTEKETVTTAAVCAVPNNGKPCGLPETSMIHNPNSDASEAYHVFHAVIKTKGAGASGD